MKSLRDYVAETEQWVNDPTAGDEFDIELAPDSLFETYVVDTTEDGVVIHADEQALGLLEQHGVVLEDIASYGPVGYGGMGQTFFEKDIKEHGGGIGPRQHWQSMMEQPVEEGFVGDREYNRVMPFVKRIAGEVTDYDRDEFGEELWSLLDQKYGAKFAQSVLDDLDVYWHEYSDMTGQGVAEGAMKELDIELQDYKTMTPQQFQSAYGMKKADWAMRHNDLLQKHGLQTDWTGKTGFDYVRETSAYMSRMLELAGVADHKYDKADDVYHEDQSAAIVAKKELDQDAAQSLGMTEEQADMDCYEDDMEEAKYQGREVPLGKPMRGDVKKFKVYVKDPKTGNVKKVNFGHGGKSAKRAGEKTLSIKKSNPKRRKSFRARHRCDNPGPRTKARYWSCRMW